MSGDVNELRLLFSIIQWGFTILVGFYAWWVGKNRATSQAMNELSKRIDDNARRLDAVEKDQREAPGHKDMQGLRDDIATLREAVREMSGAFNGQTKAVDMMMEHLLTNRGQRE